LHHRAIMENDPAATPLLRHIPDPLLIHHPVPFRIPAPAPVPTATAAANGGPKPAPPPLSGLQRFAILTFSVLRIFRGLAFIVYPALSVDSLDMPENPSNTLVLGGLLGVRDLLLGGLLYTADETQEREVRRALVVNLLSDAMDTFILIFSAACAGEWEGHRLAAIAAVAVLALLEHLTLFTMGDDDGELEMLMAARGRPGGMAAMGGYQTMLIENHDKKMRLETWLTDLRLAEEEVGSTSEACPEQTTWE
jgi:hypothetical protein